MVETNGVNIFNYIMWGFFGCCLFFFFFFLQLLSSPLYGNQNISSLWELEHKEIQSNQAEVVYRQTVNFPVPTLIFAVYDFYLKLHSSTVRKTSSSPNSLHLPKGKCFNDPLLMAFCYINHSIQLNPCTDNKLILLLF